MRIWPASLSAKGQTKGSWAGVVCPAGCIDKAGRIVTRLTVSYWRDLKQINYV